MFRRTLDRARAVAALAALLALAVLALAAFTGAVRADASPARSVTATVTGDDNGDGVIHEEESGWDCSTMGNRQCGPDGTSPAVAAPLECEFSDAPADVFRLCVDVGAQPAYGWTNPDGSKVGIPSGDALLQDLEEEPGSSEWAEALRALRAEWTEHH